MRSIKTNESKLKENDLMNSSVTQMNDLEAVIESEGGNPFSITEKKIQDRNYHSLKLQLTMETKILCSSHPKRKLSESLSQSIIKTGLRKESDINKLIKYIKSCN